MIWSKTFITIYSLWELESIKQCRGKLKTIACIRFCRSCWNASRLDCTPLLKLQQFLKNIQWIKWLLICRSVKEIIAVVKSFCGVNEQLWFFVRYRYEIILAIIPCYVSPYFFKFADITIWVWLLANDLI